MTVVRFLISLCVAVELHLAALMAAFVLPLILRLLTPQPQPLSLIEIEVLQPPAPTSSAAAGQPAPATREEGRPATNDARGHRIPFAEVDIVRIEPPAPPEPPKPEPSKPVSKPSRDEGRLARLAALREASDIGLLAILGSGDNAPLGDVLGGGSGAELGGLLAGAATGEPDGYGGLGVATTGRHGGGTGEVRAGGGALADIGSLSAAGAGSVKAPSGPAPVVTIGSIRVEGPDDATSSVTPSLQRTRARLRACYRRALDLDPSLHGRITVRFAIEPRGSVASVATGPAGTLPEPDELSDPTLTRCVAQAITSTRFRSTDEPLEVSAVIRLSVEGR